MARKKIELRTLTTEEETQIRKWAHSQTEKARLVKRAKLIEVMLDRPELGAVNAAREAGFKSVSLGPSWVRRFNEEGLDSLEDLPRSGAPPTHTENAKSQLIELVVQKPESLDLPYALWTIRRLKKEYQKRYGVNLSEKTIWSWLKAEGLNWKRQQSWFHDAEKHDPEFMEKRGPSSDSTPNQLLKPE